MARWKELLEEASERVQEAADDAFGGRRRAEVVGAGASGDETLFADRRAEDELLAVLSRASDLRILSEERGEIGEKGSRYLAVLDPIDGSSNFARGIPFYCTSVCIVDGSGLGGSKYALVRNLVNGDVYYAEKGKGASKNGRPIRTSGVATSSDAVAGVDISKASSGQIERLAPLIASLKRQVHFGANALELCLVADGTIDAFVDVRGRMRVTDFAAAQLIAKEAGAVVTSPSGEDLNPPLDLRSRFNLVAAANSRLHSKLLPNLRGFR